MEHLDDWNLFRYQLMQRRLALGLSQRDLAQTLGVTQTRISDWELGNHVPLATNVIIWCRALGVKIGMEKMS